MRQHDLRAPHTCQSGGCPAPLVQFPDRLSTLSMSPLTPWQFVVGGESIYVCTMSTLLRPLFTDRRYIRATYSTDDRLAVVWKRNGAYHQIPPILLRAFGGSDVKTEGLANREILHTSLGPGWLRVMAMKFSCVCHTHHYLRRFV